ncbi:hypothetical protein Ddc_04673 [Ditylenchus destructor]|nr:hypothetical protein Ddc_04673 [Ditylenchus destructor]
MTATKLQLFFGTPRSPCLWGLIVYTLKSQKKGKDGGMLVGQTSLRRQKMAAMAEKDAMTEKLREEANRNDMAHNSLGRG